MTPAPSVPSAALLPNFVVIGAMRSGSTSLYKYLQAHPDVFMPRKEIHFFDVKWDRGIAWYHTRCEGYAGQTAVGEATPTYLADPVALDRMARTIPDARLVAVLRDPIDRAYSHYWMEHARERDPRTFEEAVADELAQRPGAPASDYLERGRHARQLEQVCERFPRPHVHVVLLDDLRDRPHETYAATCRFLGSEDGFVPPRIGERVNWRSGRCGCGTCAVLSPRRGGSDASSEGSTLATVRMSQCRPRPDPNWFGTSAPTTNRLPIGSDGISRCGAHRDRGHTRL